MTLNIADIWKYDLKRGPSLDPRLGACLFDAAMWLVYGTLGDSPPCSCPIIRIYAAGLNDLMDRDTRQLLKPFILRVVGNRDPGAEMDRLRYIVLETARRIVPLGLRPWSTPWWMCRGLPDDATFQQICEATSATFYGGFVPMMSPAGPAWEKFLAASSAAKATETVAHAGSPTVVWRGAIAILDGALRIGKQSPEFDESAVRNSVAAFARARELA